MASPSSTNRRVASESVGISGCFSAHFTIEARRMGSARNPIIGVKPVAERPPASGLASIAFFMFLLCVDASPVGLQRDQSLKIAAFVGAVVTIAN
jgi:hypothetical protein